MSTGSIDAFSVFLGMNAKLYINAGDGPAVFGNVKDVTMNFSRSTADVTTRANDGWRANVGTLREATASFQMVRYTGSGTDNDPSIIIDAFLENGAASLIKAAILDGPADHGGQGVFGEWSVTSCNRSEALEDAVTYDVELSLTKYRGWYPNDSAEAGDYVPTT